MCGGASSTQNDINAEQTAFYKQLTDQYATIFGQNQAITGALTQAFTPILNAGPSQTGFSPAEETALRTENTEGTATNYAAAQRATAQALANRGGGNDFLPSSVDANLIAANANRAAATRSQGDLGITQANYERGYQNWQQAAAALATNAAQLNPNAYASSSTSAGGAAASEANAITQQNNSLWTAAIGALGGVAGSAVGGLTGGLGSSLFKGATQMLANPNSTIANYNSWANMAPPTVSYPGQMPGLGGPVPAFP